MLYKIQVNIVVNIICGLLGYGLYRFYQHIGPLEFVIIIILIGIVIWPCAKELKDRYDIDMFNAVASVVLPFSASDWLADGLVTKLVGLLIANASMFALSLLIPLWAVDDVRHSILEILDTLAALYRELGKYFREGCVSTNLQDGDVLKLIESFKGSQEKANSSRKFISWENVIPWRQHPQEQYEYIGCLIDRSVSNIKFLFRYLIPKSAEKYSKIEMEELICNEIQNIKHNSQLCKSLEVMCIKTAMALQGLHLSIKHKTTPSASTIDHVNNAKHCASLLMEEKKANHIIGSRLTESVMQMEELANLVEELVSHVHLKQQSPHTHSIVSSTHQWGSNSGLSRMRLVPYQLHYSSFGVLIFLNAGSGVF
ncbi:hypothetical protein LUZ63_012252 [Rhynchospora breviuscula]|uniref:Uncharacterized protein n=1 Tax=Rhynchospora breviuscula TaxID=2022672 RepID=A0A9Q0CLC3_9POAL|nr:hypothetical protein LUZ63_012252 [Rhynchospora breviuscula]